MGGSQRPHKYPSTSLELDDLSDVAHPQEGFSDLLPPEELGPVGSALIQFDDVTNLQSPVPRRIWNVTRQIALDNSIAIYHPLGEFDSLAEARSAAEGAETIYVQQPGNAGSWTREGT